MGFDLSKYNEDFNKAETNSFEDPGVGRFQVRFKKIDMKETKAGDPAFNVLFKIISGEKKGMTFFHFQTIIPARDGKNGTLGIIKGNFQAINFPGTVDEWWKRANEWIDTCIEVDRQANGVDNQGRPNYNVYWKKALDIPIGSDVDISPPPIEGAPF